MSLRKAERVAEALHKRVDGLDASAPGREWSEDSLRGYTEAATNGRFEWYRHNVVLNAVLERVAAGDLKRVLIFEPPRHGKTEQVSRVFPGYFLHRHPTKWVGLASYGADLAHGFGRDARRMYREAGGALDAESTAAREWLTAYGGGMWSAGVGGPLTGRGGDLLIIDDPLKNAEEADSELVRQRHVDWWQSTFTTRAEPGAAIIVVATRWHPADLPGWILEVEPEAREGWHIVNLPAVAEEEPPEFPDTCTVEPDWREPGEALCPERYDEADLEAIKRRVGSRVWAALYQQRPRPRDGLFFKASWFEVVPGSPRDAYARIRYWDTAGTDGAGDYTVGALLSKSHDGVFYVEDIVRGQWSPAKRDSIIRSTAEADRREYGDVEVWLEQEAGVLGTERTQHTIRLLAGFSVRAERPTGSKVLRADPLAAQAEIGNVKLVRAPWNTAFLDELCAFPHVAHDDQVDATAGAFAKLSAHRTPAKVRSLRFRVV